MVARVERRRCRLDVAVFSFGVDELVQEEESMHNENEVEWSILPLKHYIARVTV